MNAVPEKSRGKPDQQQLELDVNPAPKAPQTSGSSSTLYRRGGETLLRRALSKLNQTARMAGYRTKLYQMRLQGPHPLQLNASPDDPAPGSAMIGNAMLGGDLLYGPEHLDLTAAPWSMLWHKSQTFFNYGQSFAWLRNLAQVSDQRAARECAETLTRHWIDTYERWDETVWAPALIGSRLSNWIVHAPLLLSSSDMVYRSKVLSIMAHQARHLNNTIGDAPAGLNRVRAAAGLAFAGLLLPTGINWRLKGEKWLERALGETVLRDGGTVGRNPAHAIKILRLLILVRAAYQEAGVEIPQNFLFAIDRLAPFIRMMRHGGGMLGQFNGAVGEGGFGTDAILDASRSAGKAGTNAPYTGFQRIVHGQTLVLMDTGCPPAGERSAASHAGTLSFEMSEGAERIICNMGPAVDAGPMADLAGLARTTAAHSTLVLNDTNSSSMQVDGTLGKGVERVRLMRRAENGGTWLEADHDGYEQRFGFLHARRLFINDSGFTVDGLDELKPEGRRQKASKASVRFHLHPDISVEAGPTASVILLRTRSGSTWLFESDHDINVEDSLYMAQPNKPVRSRQLAIIQDKALIEATKIHWKLTKQS